MDATPALTIRRHFGTLRDPRMRRRRRHRLLDIITMAICAVIADCDNFEDVGLFARKRLDWFRRFMDLPHGAPSPDTFARVFSRLGPSAFGACFSGRVRAIAAALGLPRVAIDGKTLRRSSDRRSGSGPLHVVSAWAAEQNLSLAQIAVDAKSDEITAIPKLLELLELKGALVTIDAMGCQKEIAAKVVAGGGDYVLAVKENQPNLLADVRATVAKAPDGELPAGRVEEYTTTDRGHGREEERSYVVVRRVEEIRDRSLWAKLTCVGMCRRERTVNGKAVTEAHYFIGSRRMGAAGYGLATRGHWGVENNLHWQLDVTFGEDASRILDRNAAQNFTWLRRMALGLLKRHPNRSSIRGKRKEAAMDLDFLEEIIRGESKLGKV